MANTVINEVIANGAVYANGYYGTGIANAYVFRSQSYAQEIGSADERYTDVININLATYAPAPASLYFYNYSSADRVEVYQGNTLITQTGNATVLTAADRAFLLSDNAGQFFNDSPDLYLKDFVLSTINSQSYATFAGKLTWSHNPALGSTYTIRALKGNGSSDWRYMIEFPIDGLTVGCPPIPPKKPPPPPPPVIVTPQGGGGGCGCKIACTAMHDTYGIGGYRAKLWLGYGSTMAPEYQAGYHALFLPLIRYVYYSGPRNPLKNTLKYLLENVVKHRTADIWKKKHGKVDPLGRAYRVVFEPICWLAGKLIGKK